MRTLDIRARMLLAALLPLALISTLLAVVFLLARFGDMQSAYDQRNRAIARQTALASEYGLFSANVAQLQALATGALHGADVRWVGIFGGRGQLLAGAGQQSGLPLSPPMSSLEIQGAVREMKLDWVAQPVYPSDVDIDDLYSKNEAGIDQQPNQLGQVVMVFSRETVNTRKREMLLTGSVIGAFSLLFGMALAWYLSRGVIRPITRITHLVERIGHGDFAAVSKLRDQHNEHEPLWVLQNNIYQMADRLSQARLELEQQVAQATQALRGKKEEAEQANLAKSRFLAAASHDLRQPTHALGLFVSRLAQLPHDTRTCDLIRNLDASVRAMQNLLDGLLDISRLEARAVQVNKQPFAVSVLFEQLQQDLSEQAAEKGLRLRVRPTNLWVMSDATLIYRVLLNLAGNALRYTERGGVLVVARQRASGSVELQVWDSGIGIAAQHQQAVFDEFFQVGNVARDRTKGLGLGLNIVQRTVNLLDHLLVLNSQPGRGTRFALTLPGSPSQNAVFEGPPRDTPIPDDLRGKCVLVVEDDALAGRALVGLLDSWGMRVAQAHGPADALQCLAEGLVPAVIVSDYRLQDGCDGIELVQCLRQRLGRATPACLISGDTDAKLMQSALAAGLTLLHKPVRPAKLRSLLRHLLADQGDQRSTGVDLP
jgi:two-component system, sensor histidine kinase